MYEKKIQSYALQKKKLTRVGLSLFHSLCDITIKACKLITPVGITRLIENNQYLQMIMLNDMNQFSLKDVEKWEEKNILVNHDLNNS